MLLFYTGPSRASLLTRSTVGRPDGPASGGAGTSDALDGRPEEREGDVTTQPAEG